MNDMEHGTENRLTKNYQLELLKTKKQGASKIIKL
jgi:hypothetical protein